MIEEKTEQKETMRLNKFLSDAGVCSRREADRYVEEGRIEINGRKAVLGERITGEEEIRLDDRLIKINRRKTLIAVNKPKGIVCTTSARDKDNIVDYLGYPERIYPVGRLDKDSEGLILMTNDGALMDEILRARNYHEKEYDVRVDQPITKEFIRDMSNGVAILDTVTRPCKVTQINKYRFRIILTQGLNRQIRRMCEALGYRVRDLKRIRIMNIKLGDLPLGAYRELTAQEWEELNAALSCEPRAMHGQSGDKSAVSYKHAKDRAGRDSRRSDRKDGSGKPYQAARDSSKRDDRRDGSGRRYKSTRDNNRGDDRRDGFEREYKSIRDNNRGDDRRKGSGRGYRSDRPTSKRKAGGLHHE